MVGTRRCNATPYYPIYDVSADVRVEVTPKDAAVYVDGYYAGIVDDFDGFFQHLTLSPGEHALTIYLDGYRTVHQQLRLSPRSTSKVRYKMVKLGAGETSEAPTLAPPVPQPPPGSFMPPRTPARGPFAPPPGPGAFAPPPPPDGGPSAGRPGVTDVGTIVLHVQPGGADVTIDGERWASSDDARLVVQVSAGRHRVEIRKSGYRPLTTDVDVRGGSDDPAQRELVTGVMAMNRLISARVLSAACFMLATLSGGTALAQDGNAGQGSSGPMTVERVREGWDIAPDVKVTRFDGGTHTLAGLYGGWMIDNTLMLGVRRALADRFHAYSVNSPYGGAVIEWREGADRAAGFSVKSLFGFWYGEGDDHSGVLCGLLLITCRVLLHSWFSRPSKRTSSSRSPKPTSSSRLLRTCVCTSEAVTAPSAMPECLEDQIRGATGSVSLEFGPSR